MYPKGKYWRIVVIIPIILIFDSCATIFYGKSGVVKFDSKPQGGDVYIMGERTGKQTPCQVDLIKEKYFNPLKLRNKGGILYEIHKENYAPDKGLIKFKIHSLFWFDMLPIYIPAMIDMASNRMFRFKGSYSAELTSLVNRTDTIIKEKVVYVDSDNKKPSYVYKRHSDVDNEIGKTQNYYPYRFALIIGNEDYCSYQKDLSSEVNVDFARNDASAFKDYATNIMGIPDQNIIFLLDATAGQMNQAISKMNLLAKNTSGKAEIFVYYAGHGLPDEETKEPYLIPVDITGKTTTNGIKLIDLYNRLTEFPIKNLTVFIDACFSGGARNQGLYAARGVKVRPKEQKLKGNLLVLAASSGDQSSLSYREKEHGIFTYFLLKKLKETKGKVSYSSLANYLIETVTLQSILINDKEQTPQINISEDIINSWKSMMIVDNH